MQKLRCWNANGPIKNVKKTTSTVTYTVTLAEEVRVLMLTPSQSQYKVFLLL